MILRILYSYIMYITPFIYLYIWYEINRGVKIWFISFYSQINIKNKGKSFGFKIYDAPDEFKGEICRTCRVKEIHKGITLK